MENEGKRWLNLDRQIRESEGFRVISLMNTLVASNYPLNKNYAELSNAISSYEKDILIWEIKNKQKFDNFLLEIMRLLHNHLASIASLIDHTRVFCGELANKQFESDYKTKLKELKTYKCVYFLKDLRNYTQHCKLTFVSATMKIHILDQKTHKVIVEK